VCVYVRTQIAILYEELLFFLEEPLCVYACERIHTDVCIHTLYVCIYVYIYNILTNTYLVRILCNDKVVCIRAISECAHPCQYTHITNIFVYTYVHTYTHTHIYCSIPHTKGVHQTRIHIHVVT
jgi:hypothetical protein